MASESLESDLKIRQGVMLLTEAMRSPFKGGVSFTNNLTISCSTFQQLDKGAYRSQRIKVEVIG